MNREAFKNDAFYHVYNRGVEKRNIFSEPHDTLRFLESMREFNVVEPIGSLYQHSFRKKNEQLSGETAKLKKLVEVVAYCLNPNHFHFILKQVHEGGISEYMKRLAGGYTWYFNHKYCRSGGLFQGVFKSLLIDNNEYLLHVSAYVNLNNEAHRLPKRDPLFHGLERSSWAEYSGRAGKHESQCEKKPVLGQFRNRKEYVEFAMRSLEGIKERKSLRKEIENLLLD